MELIDKLILFLGNNKRSPISYVGYMELFPSRIPGCHRRTYRHIAWGCSCFSGVNVSGFRVYCSCYRKSDL